MFPLYLLLLQEKRCSRKKAARDIFMGRASTPSSNCYKAVCLRKSENTSLDIQCRNQLHQYELFAHDSHVFGTHSWPNGLACKAFVVALNPRHNWIQSRSCRLNAKVPWFLQYADSASMAEKLLKAVFFIFDFVFMTKRGILPKACFAKWHSVTSLEID